jgi:hypothetical protein
MDKLKELSVKLDGKIRLQKLFNINFEETSLRKLMVKDYRQYKIKIDEYKDLFTIGIKVNSNLSCSINKPDKVFLYNIPKYFSDLPYKIYVSEDTYTFVKNDNLKAFWNSLAILLKKIGLSECESVFLYKNYVFFSLAAKRDLVSILDDIIDLINANKKVFKKELLKKISSKRIPENLKPLIPFLKKYSISDDSDREQLIEGMKKSEKIKLINSVQPFFDEINSYLDSFKDIPLNEEAMLLGELAELVSELKIKYSVSL